MPFEPKKVLVDMTLPTKKQVFCWNDTGNLRGRFVWEFQILVLVKKKGGLKKKVLKKIFLKNQTAVHFKHQLVCACLFCFLERIEFKAW